MEKVIVMGNRTYEDENEDAIEIDIVELLFALKKKLWMIILAAMIGCLRAGIYNKVILSPVHTSTSMVYVLSKETTLTSLADPQIGSQLAKDCSVMITSKSVPEEVIEKQKLSLSYNQLKSMVRVSDPADTRILNVSVSDTDPVKAKAIIDAVVEASSDYIGDIMEMIPPKIIENGVVPDNPTSPNIKRSTALGGLALSAAVCSFITPQVVMNDTVRSEEDVSRYLDISVLAVIPKNNIEEKDNPEKGSERRRSRERRKTQAKRAKRRKQDAGQILSLRNTGGKDYHFEGIIETLRTNLQFYGSSLKAIMFTSSLPDKGKSEIAFFVGASFGSIGKEILLIDVDIRKSIFIKKYEIRGSPSGLSQYLNGQKTMEDVCYTTDIESFYVIPASPYSSSPAELLEDQLFKELLEKTKEKYDYIAIDTPPMANLTDGATIAGQCDGAVIVIENDTVSYHLAQKVKVQLEKNECHILDAVLDRVGGDYENGYHKKYYGKYYGGYVGGG